MVKGKAEHPVDLTDLLCKESPVLRGGKNRGRDLPDKGGRMPVKSNGSRLGSKVCSLGFYPLQKRRMTAMNAVKKAKRKAQSLRQGAFAP